MKRIVSIGISSLSFLAIIATAAMTYIGGYYLDEYEGYVTTIDHAVIYFAAEFILVFLTFFLLALILARPYKKQYFLFATQCLLVGLTIALTLVLFLNFMAARHEISEQGGNTEVYLNDFK